MIHPLDDDYRAIEDVAHRVHLAVSEHCAGDCCAMASHIGECAREAVMALWSSPVKTFIPLLAYRHVEGCVRLGYCPESEQGSVN